MNPMRSTLEPPVGRHLPSQEPTRDRIDLRADSIWIARVRRQAERLGISLSDYIRQATTRQLERDESSEPEES